MDPGTLAAAGSFVVHRVESMAMGAAIKRIDETMLYVNFAGNHLRQLPREIITAAA